MSEHSNPAYTFIQHPYDEESIVPNTIIEHHIMSKEISLPEMLEAFERFLQASGFIVNADEHLNIVKFADEYEDNTVETCMSCKLNLVSLEQELLCYVRYIAENEVGGSPENAVEQRDEFIVYAQKILQATGELEK